MSTTTFRSAVVRDPRGPESVEIISVPVRAAGPGEVRVRIEAASVNPADVGVTDGFFHSIGLVHQPDHTGLGWDFAGTVLEAGAGVDLAPGTRVAGIVPGFDRDFGSYAEEIVASVDWVAVVPDGLDSALATTVPLNALTADQLVAILGDGEGRRLLVTGAAGAVGGFVVPLAKARGWAVTGLARTSDEAFVRGLGADFTADDTTGGWDAVADAAGLQEAAAGLVRDGGLFAGVRPAALPAAGAGVTVRAVSVEPDAARLAALLDGTARGVLPTKVASELPLDAVVESLQTVSKGGVRGRVVLRP